MHASAQTVSPISLRRRVTDHAMTGVAILTVLLVLAPLVAIFGYLMYRGIGSINWAFLTQTPKPVGEAGGGMANAIVGSIFILGIASLIGVPFGVGAGIYLAEFGRNRFGSAIRFTADVLNGVPSIVIGIVGWSILVRGRGFGSHDRGGIGGADGSVHHRFDPGGISTYPAGASPRGDRATGRWTGSGPADDPDEQSVLRPTCQ